MLGQTGSSLSPLIDSAQGLALSLIAHGRTRLQLLGLEVEQERQRIASVVVAGLLGYFFLTMTLGIGAVVLIVGNWDGAHRWSTVAGVVGGFAILTVVSFAMMASRLARPSALFRQSLNELRRDESVLAAQRAPEGNAKEQGNGPGH